ncbi:MAG: UDP-N-acetylglucosamine 2-epimerase (hydrolyzing) [Muribaculaceae bacterium]|nr:UDP-N-acetylglucosamine 2-epimerase (hydrolyzing) [Muribaculaceae bacterium]
MIAIATSTRADWGLLSPLAKELQKRGIPYTVLASNMHLMPEMGMTVDDIRAAGENPVELATAGATISETLANSTRMHGEWFAENKPDAVIILGDRYEMLGVASAATVNGSPIIHIAGGTVSEGAMDNAIRNAISQLASLHLTETEKCAARLEGMGIDKGNIIVSGAIGVWNTLNVPLMSREELQESLGRKLPEKFFVGTLHAATLDSIPPEKQMEEFLAGIEGFMEARPGYGAILTYPNNDTDPTPLIAMLKDFEARHPESVIVVPSLGMRRYLSAVALSEGVIGNSSSGIVEVASLGVPTLDIGLRQNGRERAVSVIHCDATRGAITMSLSLITTPMIKGVAAKRVNPYYHADTPAVMADAIEEWLRNKYTQH